MVERGLDFLIRTISALIGQFGSFGWVELIPIGSILAKT